VRRSAAVDPDRVRGAFLGLAVGDTGGAAVAFRPRGTLEPLPAMDGAGPRRPGMP